MKANTLRGFALLLVLAITAPGAEISSIGSWTKTVDANDLIAGAGSEVASQYESMSGTTSLDIVNTAGGSWRILARRSDGTWHPSFTLTVRRTSDGSGSGSILGGASYVEITTLDTEIFTGTGDRSGVGLQFRLTGMSKSVSPYTYSSGIIFTVASQ